LCSLSLHDRLLSSINELLVQCFPASFRSSSFYKIEVQQLVNDVKSPLRFAGFDIDDLSGVCVLDWVRCEIANFPDRMKLVCESGRQLVQLDEFADFGE
jgi:hypothetical protein